MEDIDEMGESVPWVTGLETNILHIGEKAVGYKIMHVKAAQNARRVFNWLMYTAIIIGPLSGFFSGIGATINPEAPTTFPIVAACTGFASGILVAAVKFGKWEEQIEAHKRAAAHYTSLESNVRRNLAIPRNNRINPVKYIEWVGTSYDDLFKASPLIPATIFEQYTKEAKERGITLPDEYAITVTIDAKYHDTKIDEMMASHAIDVNQKSIDDPHLEPPPAVKRSGSSLMKRSPNNCIPTTELNKYDNGNMEYEMKRLMGFGKD
jgi:hypothetical protein